MVDPGVQEAAKALIEFVSEWNETHVDQIASVDCTCWVCKGRLYPVTQFFSLGSSDLNVNLDVL